MRLDDPLHERLPDGVLDLGGVARGCDEELVLDVHVVLGRGDGRHHGLLDALLGRLQAGAPVAHGPEDLDGRGREEEEAASVIDRLGTWAL